MPVSLGKLQAQKTKAMSTCDVTSSVFEKGLLYTELDFYAGTLMLHGMSEFALLKGNEAMKQQVIGLYRKFGNSEIKAKGNFISYEAGGSGAAYLAWKGATAVLDSQVAVAATKMMQMQKRSPEGLMTAAFAKKDMIFIDVAFAVTPYLLYSGLKFNKKEYVDFAVNETIELFRILKDPKTGLLHQARGFKGEGSFTQDNWSRGNGWGAFALATLVRDLPATHPKHKAVVQLAQQYFKEVLRYQNKEGMWHQEMTDSTSYVETSGSGLLLYAIGIMLEKGLLEKRFLNRFKLGLSGFTSYIGTDGSVSHACFSCLAPGNGTKEDYKNRAWLYNDHHAFGPVVLAFAQAVKMGIHSITPLKKAGHYSIFDSPEVPVTYVMHARGSDVAWENDRIAFRLYGPSVRNKVRSGVDVWAKKVDYPVLEKWYQLNSEGKDYHVDRGEGCDFYHMGKRLGCGAIAVWKDGKPYGAETFDSYRITKNQADAIAFELDYKTWNVPGIKIEELKNIELSMGTNFFKVTSILKSEQDTDLTIAIGLSTFGKPEVTRNEQLGALTVWENMDTTNGSLGTAVLVNKNDFAGFANYEGDEYILVKVKTNIPFVYYAGAGWERNKNFSKSADWINYVKLESGKVKF